MAWAIAAIMLLIAAIMALVFRFLLEMRRVVDTVHQRDPFVPANADRLRRMAWLHESPTRSWVHSTVGITLG